MKYTNHQNEKYTIKMPDDIVEDGSKRPIGSQIITLSKQVQEPHHVSHFILQGANDALAPRQGNGREEYEQYQHNHGCKRANQGARDTLAE